MEEHLLGVGDRLRRARLARGLTQDDLAIRCGIRGLTVSKAERGVAEPKTRVLDALARELGVSLDWLIRGDGPGPAADAPPVPVS